MRAGRLGAIATPLQGNRVNDFPSWCADNGCFSKGYPGDLAFLEWLAAKQPLASTCKFATAPDVLGDAKATLERSKPFLPIIRALGFPAALVAQDGLEDLKVPWDTFTVLFVGGTTEWKLGPGAASLAAEAVRRGKWVHMGRVNSRKRLRYAESIGCGSVDGTYIAFGPSKNLARMLRWLGELEEECAQSISPVLSMAAPTTKPQLGANSQSAA